MLELKTRTDVVLDRGKATITISKAGKRPARFTLQTPSATVTDIGTSFGVMVDKAGETSVTVAWLDELEADRHKPSVILLDGRNEVVRSSGHA